MAPDPDGPAETLARQLTGANASGVVAFATEAGLFQQAGISPVICGPGDIAQAHQPNEFITPDQMAAGEAFLSGFAFGPPPADDRWALGEGGDALPRREQT